jgi:hypothetical protein
VSDAVSNPEDAKIITLARSARARVAASGGACARDTTGRTYASANVSLGDLHLSATVLAVAQAVASGSTGLEAVAVSGGLLASDLDAVRAAGGSGVVVFVLEEQGDVAETVTT